MQSLKFSLVRIGMIWGLALTAPKPMIHCIQVSHVLWPELISDSNKLVI
jgi:hypothetical protein